MAQRRMFSLAVTDTDIFLDMPVSTQALYFHLGMHGDDDGFVGSPKKIMRAAGCGSDDIKLLAAKGFIIPFDSGVVVLRDWKLNNTLKNDRYRETLYQKEKSLISLDSVGRYTLGTGLEPSVFQAGSNAEPEHNATEHNITVQNEEKADKPPRTRFVPPSLTDVAAYCRSRNSPVDPVKFFEYFEAGDWRDAKGQPVKNWKQKLLTWENQEKQRVSQHPETHAADLSWRDARSFASEDLIEEPPGSGQYRLREKVSANA